MRSYKCLNKNVFNQNNYQLLPIRDQDKFQILDWRNTQIDILRKITKITKEQQITYFEKVVTPLFVEDYPKQLLWSLLLDNELIGYGGLVHIDWEAKHAEISFLLANERNANVALFIKDWNEYMAMVEDIAFNHLKLNKIHTYAYNIRPYYFDVLYKRGFLQEGRLKEHVFINGDLVDVLILSKFNHT